ncbi:ankyrin repeat protein [Magpiepox virus 2]|nr:ankyrin repeat protein [Magpiepox virus 2]
MCNAVTHLLFFILTLILYYNKSLHISRSLTETA